LGKFKEVKKRGNPEKDNGEMGPNDINENSGLPKPLCGSLNN
jgi:hypothetical protein